jgi:hypothetical protein
MNGSNIDCYAIDDQSKEIARIFACSMSATRVIWPSFVVHWRLAICDCLWFTEGLF